MKHPHYDMMMQWAADTSKTVQWRSSYGDQDGWVDIDLPSWSPDLEYRFKSNADTVKYIYDVERPMTILGSSKKYVGVYDNGSIAANYSKIKLVFDGVTGNLKSAEKV